MPFDGTQLDAATKLLIDVKDAIIRDGWCVGIFTDSHGRHCMLGGFDAVFGNEDGYAEKRVQNALHRLIAAIPEEAREKQHYCPRLPVGTPDYGAIAQYNNDQKDVEAIYAWLDRAIAAQ